METSTWVKIGAVGGFGILLTSAAFGLKWQHDLLTKQTLLEQSMVEMKQLGDGLVRSQSGYATKEDLASLAKNVDLSKIQDDLNKYHADIKAVQVVSIGTTGYVGNGLPSTTSTPRTDNHIITINENSDPYHYLHNIQTLSLNENLQDKTSLPIGSVNFKAWEEKPWDLTIYPRIYKVTTVLGQDENNKHYAYNKFTVDTQGKTYTINIDQAKLEEILPAAKLRVSPRLYLGLGGGLAFDVLPKAFLQPSVHLSFLSYGMTRNDPNWTFLGVGLGYEGGLNRGSIIFAPVSYNIGHHLPLVNNLFLGPMLGFDTNANFAVSLGIQVGL